MKEYNDSIVIVIATSPGVATLVEAQPGRRYRKATMGPVRLRAILQSSRMRGGAAGAPSPPFWGWLYKTYQSIYNALFLFDSIPNYVTIIKYVNLYKIV